MAAGAAALHLHPRSAEGAESLAPGPVAAALRAVRDACPGVLVSLSTGYWICGGRAARLEAVASWTERPDLASVNLSEPGAEELVGILTDLGVGVEAGVASIADARLLIGSGLAERCVRVLVEPDDPAPEQAVRRAAAIDALVAHHAPELPRLHHGYGAATWAVLEAALAAGHDVRVGLEDTLVLPDGSPARDNADLVATAAALAARTRGTPAG